MYTNVQMDDDDVNYDDGVDDGADDINIDADDDNDNIDDTFIHFSSLFAIQMLHQCSKLTLHTLIKDN